MASWLSDPHANPARSRPRIALAGMVTLGLGVSGAASMIYEIGWSRRRWRGGPGGGRSRRLWRGRRAATRGQRRGEQTRAAELLGLSFRQLRYKLSKFGQKTAARPAMEQMSDSSGAS